MSNSVEMLKFPFDAIARTVREGVFPSENRTMNNNKNKYGMMWLERTNTRTHTGDGEGKTNNGFDFDSAWWKNMCTEKLN